MSKSPTTDALDTALKGDWQRCYELMHVHAVKLEIQLTDAVEESRNVKQDLWREKGVADVFREQLKKKQAATPEAA
jgi:hypothetical protein